MKKVTSLAFASLLLLSLMACASNSAKGVHVKCPACGYEFEAHPEK